MFLTTAAVDPGAGYLDQQLADVLMAFLLNLAFAQPLNIALVQPVTGCAPLAGDYDFVQLWRGYRVHGHRQQNGQHSQAEPGFARRARLHGLYVALHGLEISGQWLSRWYLVLRPY